MTIYILLLAYLLLMPALVSVITKDPKRRERLITFFGIFIMFLLLALKAPSVGVDIAGYRRQYLVSKTKDWLDTGYIYFEVGYVQLMKLFSKSGASFQLFTVFLYAVYCSSLYFFIRKYSKDATLSLIILVCYQFFVFSASGLRQTFATGICIYAYLLFSKRKPWYMVLGVLVAILAAFFHKSAVIFLVVLLFSVFRRKIVSLPAYLLAALGAYLFRPTLLRLINSYFSGISPDTAISLGGSFIMLIGVCIFMWYAISRRVFDADEEENQFNVSAVRILLLSVIASIVTSGSSMLRATMYLNVFLIPCLPNYLLKMKRGESEVLRALVAVLFMALFVAQTLIPNQLEICPYLFFWQS